MPDDADLMRPGAAGGFEPHWERVDTETAFAQQLAHRPLRHPSQRLLAAGLQRPGRAALAAAAPVRYPLHHRLRHHRRRRRRRRPAPGRDRLTCSKTGWRAWRRPSLRAPAAAAAAREAPGRGGPAALRRALQQGLSQQPMATCLTARDGTFLNVNASFLNLLGYAREEVIDRTSHELHIWVEPAAARRAGADAAARRGSARCRSHASAQRAARCAWLWPRPSMWSSMTACASHPPARHHRPHPRRGPDAAPARAAARPARHRHCHQRQPRSAPDAEACCWSR